MPALLCNQLCRIATLSIRVKRREETIHTLLFMQRCCHKPSCGEVCQFERSGFSAHDWDMPGWWFVGACQFLRVLSVPPVFGMAWVFAHFWIDLDGHPYLVARSEGGMGIWDLDPPSEKPVVLLPLWKPISFQPPVPHPYGYLVAQLSVVQNRIVLARWDLDRRLLDTLGTYRLSKAASVRAVSLPPCQNRIALLLETPEARKLLMVNLQRPFQAREVPSDVVWVGACDEQAGVWRVHAYNPANLMQSKQGQWDLWVRVATLSPITGRVLDAFQMARSPFRNITVFLQDRGAWTTLTSSPYSGPVPTEIFRLTWNGPNLSLQKVWEDSLCGVVIPLEDSWVIWNEKGKWQRIVPGHSSRPMDVQGISDTLAPCVNVFAGRVFRFLAPDGERGIAGTILSPFRFPRDPPNPVFILFHIDRDTVVLIRELRAQRWSIPWGSYQKGWWILHQPRTRTLQVWQHICK